MMDSYNSAIKSYDKYNFTIRNNEKYYLLLHEWCNPTCYMLEVFPPIFTGWQKQTSRKCIVWQNHVRSEWIISFLVRVAALAISKQGKFLDSLQNSDASSLDAFVGCATQIIISVSVFLKYFSFKPKNIDLERVATKSTLQISWNEELQSLLLVLIMLSDAPASLRYLRCRKRSDIRVVNAVFLSSSFRFQCDARRCMSDSAGKGLI